jgi:hypothetical protein
MYYHTCQLVGGEMDGGRVPLARLVRDGRRAFSYRMTMAGGVIFWEGTRRSTTSPWWRRGYRTNRH